MKIHLVDQNELLCKEWEKQFSDCEDVEVHCADYFSIEVDAVTSPANSFGFMDAGLDLAIRNKFGKKIENEIQTYIVKNYNGELQVGQSFAYWLKETIPNYILVAPTMRQPENVSETLNAYYAFRSIIWLSRIIGVESLAIPGLCTGIGKMPEFKAAFQMRRAYDSMKVKSFKPIWQLHREHRELKNGRVIE